jgi:hypothetical protein
MYTNQRRRYRQDTCHELGRSAYRILVAKPEGNNHVQDLGVDGDNIQTVLKETGWNGVNWIHLAQDR